MDGSWVDGSVHGSLVLNVVLRERDVCVANVATSLPRAEALCEGFLRSSVGKRIPPRLKGEMYSRSQTPPLPHPICRTTVNAKMPCSAVFTLP